VIDFGIARTTGTDLAVGELALTTTAAFADRFLGTLEYMSPEQFGTDEGDLDVRDERARRAAVAERERADAEAMEFAAEDSRGIRGAAGSVGRVAGLVSSVTTRVGMSRRKDAPPRSWCFRFPGCGCSPGEMALAVTQLKRELVDLIRAQQRTSQEDANEGRIREEDRPHPDESLHSWAEFHTAIESLSKPQREAVHFLWYLGLPQEEARLLGISDRTLRRHWTAAQATLRQRLDAQDFANGS
jgi:serine/threonine protein kinase